MFGLVDRKEEQSDGEAEGIIAETDNNVIENQFTERFDRFVLAKNIITAIDAANNCVEMLQWNHLPTADTHRRRIERAFVNEIVSCVLDF